MILRRSLARLVVGGLLMGGLLMEGLPTRPTPVHAEEPSPIRGVVVDGDGRFVEGYIVVGRAPAARGPIDPGLHRGDVTDAQGRFEIRPWAGHRTCTLLGIANPTHASIHPLEVASTAQDVRLVATRIGVLVGVARDPEGAPLANAEIVCTPVSHKTQRGWPGHSDWSLDPMVVRSDAQGRFRIAPIHHPGPVRLDVRPPESLRDLQVERILRSVALSGDPVDVRTLRALSIQGRVVDEAGDPVAGAPVHAVLDRSAMAEGRVRLPRGTSTDGTGAFRIHPLRERDRVSVQVFSPPDAKPAFLTITRDNVAAGYARLLVRTRRGHVLRGRIEGVEVAHLQGARVHVTDGRRRIGGVTLDGSTASFTIEGLPDGPWSIRVMPRHAGPRYMFDVLRSVESPAKEIVLRGWIPHVLEGSIEDRIAVDGLRVVFIDALGRRQSVSQSRGDGTFRFRDVAPGPGLLLLSALRGSRVRLVEDVDPRDPPGTWTLSPAAQLAGRIQGLPPGRVAGQVTVRRGPLELRAKVDPDGWFEVAPLAPGTWQLAVSLDRAGGRVGGPAQVTTGGPLVRMTWRADR